MGCRRGGAVPGREHLSLEERLAERIGGLGERLLPDAVAVADLLEVEPVGLIGFCMGGMYAMLGAATGRFARAVAFYGMIRVPEQWRTDDQVDPVDAVTSPDTCPVLAIIGTADRWTPAEDVDALDQAGVTVVRYDGADHGFAHDARGPPTDRRTPRTLGHARSTSSRRRLQLARGG